MLVSKILLCIGRHKAIRVLIVFIITFIPIQNVFPSDKIAAKSFESIYQERMDSREQCKSDFKDKELSQEEIDTILKNHKDLIKKIKQADIDAIKKDHQEFLDKAVEAKNKQDLIDVRVLNLCMADLSNLDLSGANLSYADLSHTNLENSNISNTILFYTNLSYSILINTKMENIKFSGTNLRGALLEDLLLVKLKIRNVNMEDSRMYNVDYTGSTIGEVRFNNADLQDVDLTDTYIINSDLSHAYLFNVKLKDAHIRDTDLGGASLIGIDFDGTIYEPVLESLPKLIGVAYSKNLRKITYEINPIALNELVHAFRNAGLDFAARSIVYALKHRDNEFDYDAITNNKFALMVRITAGVRYSFNYLLFEWTTMWGWLPILAILRLVQFILIFSMFYVFVLTNESREGIWKVYPDPQLGEHTQGNQPILLKLKRGEAIKIGIYFSILSAFHFGWRDFNVGSWIARLQKDEYYLEPTGFARTISGIQSLISVYLLAICLLTYFSTPFG